MKDILLVEGVNELNVPMPIAPPREIREVLFLNLALGIYQDTVPVVLIGQHVGYKVRGVNTGSSYQAMELWCYVFDPDGIGSPSIARKDVPPGGVIECTAWWGNADKVGFYTGRAELYADGVLVDTWEGNVADVR